MKKLFLVLNFFLSVIIHAQQVKYTYRNNNSDLEYQLLINKENEFSFWKMTVDAKGEKVSSDSQNNFFLNSNNIIYYNDKTIKKRVFVKDDESMIWNKSTEKTEILGFSCKSARTHFRGRDYIAYYTEEIPYKYGPWKFRGLEGLILSVKSLDGNYEFLATDYKDDSCNFNKPASSHLEDKNFIDYNNYVDIYKKHVDSYIKEQFCNCSEDGKNILKITKIEKVYSPLHDEGIVY